MAVNFESDNNRELFLNDPQGRVARCVRDRGYFAGWEWEQLVARQVVKLAEELGEVMAYIEYSDKSDIFQHAGNSARVAFKRGKFLKSSISDQAALEAELADMQVVIFVMAELLGCDVINLAVAKAIADVERGVTK